MPPLYRLTRPSARERLRSLVWDTLPEWGEIVNSLALLGWGIVLLLPTSTFTRSISFDPMRVLLGDLTPQQAELAWGLTIFSLGFGAGLALWSGRRRYRRPALILSVAFWSFVDFTFFLVNPWGLSMATYTVLLLNAAWAAFRVVLALEVDK